MQLAVRMALTPSLHVHLANDHQELEVLLEQLTSAFATGDRDVAAAAYRSFERRLTEHFDFEEEQLFAEFATVNPVEVSDLRAEHRAIRARVEELAIGVDLHQTRLAAIQELARMLREHAEREDRVLYPWADRIATDPQRRSRLEQVLAHGSSSAVAS